MKLVPPRFETLRAPVGQPAVELVAPLADGECRIVVEIRVEESFDVLVPVGGWWGLRGGLGAASALALARGLGEFGATLLFAGSLQGVTQTLPLAIYAQFEVDFNTALAIGALFVCFGAAVLLALKLIPGWTRSISLWTFRSASSPST